MRPIDPFRTPGVFEYWIRPMGTPVPQGSKSVTMRSGKPVMFDQQGSHLKAWRECVAQAAWKATNGEQLDTPVMVTIWFYLERPASVKRTHMCVKPDIDKLCRSTLDGLGDSILADDSRVVELSARKQYADDTHTGAMIHIRTIKDGEL